MRTKLTRIIVLFQLLIMPATAPAETLVLLQGYLADADYWRETGVIGVLAADGWVDAGTLHTTRSRIRPDRPTPASSRRVYTLALPSEAPLMVQLRYLERYVDFILDRHPYESLLLAGHSAGGVLGRLYMVEHPETPVGALITVASPHLGAEIAEIGAMAGNSPLAWIAPLLGGGALSRSQGLYYDLMRERPGSLLFWLNRQQHPLSRYIAIVREDEGLLNFGDLLVPSWSQDMNQVAALRGRAIKIVTGGGHGLSKLDGELLRRILRNANQV